MSIEQKNSVSAPLEIPPLHIQESDSQEFTAESAIETKENIQGELRKTAIVYDKKKVLVTGGTGFFGASLAKELRDSGQYDVYVTARAKGRVSAESRIHKLFEVLDPEYAGSNSELGVNILEAELMGEQEVGGKTVYYPLENWGMSPDDLEKFNHFKEIFHTLGSVSFSEEKGEQTMIVNYQGLYELLRILFNVKGDRPHLHYTSTAYVFGEYSEPNGERSLLKEGASSLNNGDAQPNNPYEDSKRRSEELLQSHPDIESTIYRPSIIAGDSETYKTLSYTGYYGFWKAFAVLKNWLRHEFDKHPEMRQLYDEYNIRFEGEILHLPIPIPGERDATVNIVPVDWVVKTLIELSQIERAKRRTPEGRKPVFHLTHERPMTYGQITKVALETLGIKDVKIDQRSIMDFLVHYHKARGKLDESILTPPEIIMCQILDGIVDYLPYVSGEPIFDKTYTNRVAPDLKPAPLVDQAYLRNSLQYALDRNFKVVT